ncbi:uncharacterized protein LOC135169892 [Diachasmimorpha longicaudata]|uniref:uncharacterized protein LOC135169892 n=1 Tax=Diachasmimorpha longicaudata TaxID=58733 RepID=UPI0030B8B6E9
MRKYEGRINHSSAEDGPGNRYKDDVQGGCNCLKCIVEFHLEIWKFIKKMEDYFHIVMLLSLSTSAVYGCMGGFLISEMLTNKLYAKALGRIFWLISVHAGMTLSYWLTEICQQNSYSLGEAAYSIQWTAKDPKISRDLLFIIRQSRIPLKFKVGKYYVPSLHLLRKFIFTILSYTSSLVAIASRETRN